MGIGARKEDHRLELHHAIERVRKKAATFYPVTKDDGFALGSFREDHLGRDCEWRVSNMSARVHFYGNEDLPLDHVPAA